MVRVVSDKYVMHINSVIQQYHPYYKKVSNYSKRTYLFSVYFIHIYNTSIIYIYILHCIFVLGMVIELVAISVIIIISRRAYSVQYNTPIIAIPRRHPIRDQKNVNSAAIVYNIRVTMIADITLYYYVYYYNVVRISTRVRTYERKRNELCDSLNIIIILLFHVMNSGLGYKICAI